MMMLQLNPPIPLETIKGKGMAHVLIDYGPEHHLLWVVFLDDGGDCWTLPNTQIKAQSNVTMGRPPTQKSIKDFVRETLEDLGRPAFVDFKAADGVD